MIEIVLSHRSLKDRLQSIWIWKMRFIHISSVDSLKKREGEVDRERGKREREGESYLERQSISVNAYTQIQTHAHAQADIYYIARTSK